MRILALSTTTMAFFAGACASAPKVGPLGEGSATAPKIVALDTTVPPRSVAVELPEPAYAALLLVAPGHSATLLYPGDSAVSNHLSAGRTALSFRIPDNLVPTDSTGMLRRTRVPSDTSLRSTRRMSSMGAGPIRPDTPAFLLLVTSPQRLDYKRMQEKTAGVSLPAFDMEALNAVAKTIKSTITEEPRTWAGYYHQVQLSRVH